MGQRKQEREFLKARVIQIIVTNGNTLTYAQIKRRLPRASEKMIYRVAQELGIRLPEREYLSREEMPRETVEESRERVRRSTWKRSCCLKRDPVDWAEKLEGIE